MLRDKYMKAQGKPLDFLWRMRRDSNPRILADRQFSRLFLSTTQTLMHKTLIYNCIDFDKYFQRHEFKDFNLFYEKEVIQNGEFARL